jgi:hypothetical protein
MDEARTAADAALAGASAIGQTSVALRAAALQQRTPVKRTVAARQDPGSPYETHNPPQPGL